METGTPLEDQTKDQAPQDNAVFDPFAVLSSVVRTLQSVDSVIASLQAFREYNLAFASRLAGVMADGGPGAGASGADSRSLEMAERAVAAEIATATRASDRTVQRQLGQAVELLERFPGTFAALFDGRISLPHARVIQDEGTSLEGPEALSRYEAAVLASAEEQAPGRVRRVAAREAERVQPEALGARYDRAVAGRCVRVTPLPDGMAELAATLPSALAHGIHDRLTRMARTHTEASGTEDWTDSPRTTDQLRADLFSELLLCGTPAAHDTPDGLLAGITARVDITVPVLTLIDGEGTPAELHGQQPIDPATAAILTGKATAWNRVLTHPISGAVLAAERYRPSEELKRLLTARDTRCRFPGCGIKARDLDLDHTHDAALGGPTEAGNLAGLCRRHHMLKHHSRWTVRQTGDGVLEWTSPAGRSYTDHPPTPAANYTNGRRTARPDSHGGGEPPPF